ncbi:MAG: glycerate kinase [Alphaproteobacteria bacterium]
MSAAVPTPDAARQLLRDLFTTAVASADPKRCVPPHLPAPPPGRTVVVGAGKASAAMARAVEAAWPGELSGLVITRYGHAVECERIEIVEAAHPVPDEAGRAATGRILELAESLGARDLLLCLVSGGGSSLLSLPAPGIGLEDKIAVNQVLLRSGATISEMNCVRKHLSAIKGGRLALAAAPARVVSLLISDVPGDDPAVIASGPTAADPTTIADARAVLERYGVDVPASVSACLGRGDSETPKPGEPILDAVRNLIVAAPRLALEAAARAARRAGFEPLVLGDALEGEAREVAKVHAGIARSAALWGHPIEPPAVLLSGGETTVTVRGGGRGGRNTEFQLAMALALDGAPGIYSVACDTDGIDGSEDNAGALVTPDTLARARMGGLDARALLAANDSYRLFSALGDLVTTGPTLTNVNDFRAILITVGARNAISRRRRSGDILMRVSE